MRLLLIFLALGVLSVAINIFCFISFGPTTALFESFPGGALIGFGGMHLALRLGFVE